MSDTGERTCDNCGKDLTKLKEIGSCRVLEYDVATEELIYFLRWFCSKKCVEEYIGHPVKGVQYQILASYDTGEF